MIQFCQTVRHHALAAEVGLILVHCRYVLKTTILKEECASGIDFLGIFLELNCNLASVFLPGFVSRVSSYACFNTWDNRTCLQL
jgi:hypothetical protein